MQTAAWREDTKKMKKNTLKFGFVSSRTFTHTHMYTQLTATIFNKNELYKWKTVIEIENKTEKIKASCIIMFPYASALRCVSFSTRAYDEHTKREYNEHTTSIQREYNENTTSIQRAYNEHTSSI